ncbi:ABC transporter permease [Mycolicibacterium smegmatis]|uniref:ABC transporter permease n=1 Tax=Mycolicibacterium smegmatis TaxID=1772 RepID=UPI0005D9C359|nr:ABC transporter permease [Mycolicibacterium smegmatis]MDF1903331.1 ABC transporter permease [Mycolicibacterium smegmatis]MDF1909854.1 ABC transporter permease [Mycolicibacterium smegmatis]MDF1921795.1 ABC transporter permease [Mycolicibacterium smegmatis]MDF1928242.1 ABC transporter permease [Mycolicibacterium smegmatis]UAK53469.1 ABC transporter permease [Mycolicibacterium smegmatis]
MTDLMTRPTIAPPGLLSPGDSSGKTLRQKLTDAVPASVARRVPAVVLPLIPIGVFLVAWHLLTENNVVAWLRFNRMPSPDAVLQALLARVSSGSYYDDLLASLQRILLGFGLAAVVGIALGVLVGRSEVARMTLRPFIELIRPIPAIALVPLTILLFPSSEQGIVFITFFAAFFPVVVSTIHAMDSMPKVWEEAAQTMGAGRMSLLFHVIIPGALPGIFAGLSVAMGVAWICVVSAEMISGQFGIGYYTWQAYGLLDYAGVVVGMISIGALGLGTAWLVERVGRRVNRWLPRAAR